MVTARGKHNLLSLLFDVSNTTIERLSAVAAQTSGGKSRILAKLEDDVN
jgi:hypothetical protein